MAADVFVTTADDALNFVESLEDPAAWKDTRVTHWHLWRDEIGTADKERFGIDRIRDGVLNHPAGIALETRKALR